MSAYPGLHELIWLFETEPKFEYDDIDWPVVGAQFETTRGDWSVLCSIGVYDQSFGVEARHHGNRVFELHLDQVVDRITIDRGGGGEALKVWPVDGHDLSEVRLQLRPHIELQLATVSYYHRR